MTVVAAKPKIKTVKPSPAHKAPGSVHSKSSRARSQPAIKPEKATEERQRLRIRVRAYDHKILDASVKQIVDTALRYGAELTGPVPLPTEIRKYTVNRSTFVHKNAREQFEMRVHKRMIDILNPTPRIIDALTNLSLPAGIDIEVKMM